MNTRLAKVSDIKPGAAKAVEIGAKSVAVFNVDGKFYAVDSTCPHKGGPLADGWIQGLTIKCPWHGATFSLETGSGIAGPCGSGVQCYEVRVSNDNLEISFSD